MNACALETPTSPYAFSISLNAPRRAKSIKFGLGAVTGLLLLDTPLLVRAVPQTS